jgi:hypothetical protein
LADGGALGWHNTVWGRLAARTQASGAEKLGHDELHDLQQIVSVLTMYPLEGINRKVQLKPLAWTAATFAEASSTVFHILGIISNTLPSWLSYRIPPPLLGASNTLCVVARERSLIVPRPHARVHQPVSLTTLPGAQLLTSQLLAVLRVIGGAYACRPRQLGWG